MPFSGRHKHMSMFMNLMVLFTSERNRGSQVNFGPGLDPASCMYDILDRDPDSTNPSQVKVCYYYVLWNLDFFFSNFCYLIFLTLSCLINTHTASPSPATINAIWFQKLIADCFRGEGGAHPRAAHLALLCYNVKM